MDRLGPGFDLGSVVRRLAVQVPRAILARLMVGADQAGMSVDRFAARVLVAALDRRR
ncbi:MAG: hypothetical protein GDA40_10830 [Rhodobacteraceae bacterium]|nr:hypothetical protein [Paracoccaceae bacterium]